MNSSEKKQLVRHLEECYGDCDIWCTCMETRELAKEIFAELYPVEAIVGERFEDMH